MMVGCLESMVLVLAKVPGLPGITTSLVSIALIIPNSDFSTS